MNSQAKVIIFLLFLFMSISFSTSPKEPPYYMYLVRGKIECDSLESLSNYTLTLYGLPRYNNEEYIHLYWYEENNNVDYGSNVTLTDSLGEFFLRTSFPEFFDSLKVALVQPEGITVFSDAIYVDSLQYTPEKRDYWVDNDTGCSSCSVQPHSDMVLETEIVYYNYYLHDVIFNICR